MRSISSATLRALGSAAEEIDGITDPPLVNPVVGGEVAERVVIGDQLAVVHREEATIRLLAASMACSWAT